MVTVKPNFTLGGIVLLKCEDSDWQSEIEVLLINFAFKEAEVARDANRRFRRNETRLKATRSSNHGSPFHQTPFIDKGSSRTTSRKYSRSLPTFQIFYPNLNPIIYLRRDKIFKRISFFMLINHFMLVNQIAMLVKCLINVFLQLCM